MHRHLRDGRDSLWYSTVYVVYGNAYGGIEMRLEIPKLLIIRGVVYIYLLGIQYPPSTRNTCDRRNAWRFPHRLKLRLDASLRSVNKIYSCAIYCLLFSSPHLPLHVKYCLLSPRCRWRDWWKDRYFSNSNEKDLHRRKNVDFKFDRSIFYIVLK